MSVLGEEQLSLFPVMDLGVTLVWLCSSQMQQQELAQMRQRDANLTALAAIGPRKKRKLDSPGAVASGAEVRGHPVRGGACGEGV